MTEATCEQRIADYYKGRMETIGGMLKGMFGEDVEQWSDAERSDLEDMIGADAMADEDTRRERSSDVLYEMPLCVEVIRTVKITLGTGGPGDWFEATIDADGSIERIEYHFNDWWDHAEINVTDDDNARAFCEQFVESALVQA